MESIITRQNVARRRPSSSSPKHEGQAFVFKGPSSPSGPAFFKGSSDAAPRKRTRKMAPSPGFLKQKPAHRTRKAGSVGPSSLARILGAIPRWIGRSLKATVAAVGVARISVPRAFAPLLSGLVSVLAKARKRRVGANRATNAQSPAEQAFPRFRLRRSWAGKAGIGAFPRLLAGIKALGGLFSGASAETGRGKPPSVARIAGAGAALVGLGVLAFVLSLPPSFPLPEGELLPAYEGADDPAANLLLDYLSADLLSADPNPDLSGLPLPRSFQVSTYTVKAGDSVGSIAKRFGRRADSIVSLNAIKDVRAIRQGMELTIPNMDGVMHTVTRGESLAKIAKDFKVEVTILADANDLGSASLKIGQGIFIPGARLPEAMIRKIYGTTVTWPGRGPISSGFGIRSDPFTGVRRFHAGLDIVVPLGTPVKAAIDGKIADLGYNANYGNYIIISNGDGLQTLYAHLEAFSVNIGQTVRQGSVIGKSGNTGYSTGPHLHFGVYRQGIAVDPLKLLK